MSTDFDKKISKVRDRLENFLQKLGQFLVWIAQKTVGFIRFMTEGRGAGIIFGLLTLYFMLLSAESYWQAIPSFADKPNFLPKLLIDDGASLENISIALDDSSFWVAAAFSTAIQTLQAYFIREQSLAYLKQKHAEYSKEEIPQAKPNGLKILLPIKKRIENHGMRSLRLQGVALLGSWTIDLLMQWSQFPLFGGNLGVNFVWLLLSIFGTEIFLDMAVTSFADKGK